MSIIEVLHFQAKFSQIGKYWWELLMNPISSWKTEANTELDYDKADETGTGKTRQYLAKLLSPGCAGWSKRTHKHTYNALSGVGVIF